MKKIIQIFCYILFSIISLNAQNTYYMSNSGNDNDDGLTPGTAWQTFTKLNAALETNNNSGYISPGDKILFNRGDTFVGQLLIKRSGTAVAPVEIGSYGSGAKPILTGVGANIGALGGDAHEVIKIINASHLIVEDLHITNNRQTTSSYWTDNKSYGIVVRATKWGGRSSGLTFRNLEFQNIYGVSMFTNPNTGTPEFILDYYKAQAFFFDSDENHDGSSNPTTPTEVGIDDVLIEDCHFENLGGTAISVRHLGGYDTNGPSERNQNYVIRNNHFENLGGDGVVFASVFNGLVENNEYHNLGLGDKNNSSDRLYGRGEGCWIWDSWNVVVQYNKQYNNKGFGDTYGAGGHIDFYCKNSLFQYNYSENTDGGFVEILGDCDNSIFRYNVSVNDGHRTDHHNYTIWLSGYVGTGNPPVPSRDNYIYNNTVYVNKANIDTQISIFAEDTYIYNNVFMFLNGSSMGIRNEDGVNGFLEDMENGGVLNVSNNMYQGSINTTFKNKDGDPLDNAWPSFSSPGGTSPGDDNGDADIYDINNGSVLINAGKSFTQPLFPSAGTGIFAHISAEAFDDGFGNTVDINNHPPNIGASNSHNSNSVLGLNEVSNNSLFTIYPNPVTNRVNLNISETLINSTIQVFDVTGKEVFAHKESLSSGENSIELPSNIKNGIYFLKLTEGKKTQTQQLILYR
ncbi:hypothetical protein KH5_15760 [Urechidicola sp. KH5]